MNIDTRSTNSLWASVLVETLVRAGVRRAVISPGSRSTPLTVALAQHPSISATPVLDERSAAFFALGVAKVNVSPVVLVCTSGTAGANYYPAVIEAHESGVPLIIITADRPPELRACASGQTVDQLKLFGGYTDFFHEFAVPELDLGRLRYLRQTTLHSVTRTLQPQPGPVHLNAPFRDPLPPLPDGGAAEAFARGVDWNAFFGEVAPPVPVAARMPSQFPIPAAARGVIIVGPNQPANSAGFATAVGNLSRRLGWPVLADGLAPVRNHAAAVPHLVTLYDAVLRNPGAAGRLKPEAVLCIGGWPTSKVLRGWLEACDVPTWLVSERIDNRDALHGRTAWLSIDVETLAAAVPERNGGSAFQRSWAACERLARVALDERLARAAEMIEFKAAWLLAQHLPERTPLFISNSMPIRDVEYVWPAGDREIRPFCNRGANGIDGTLSAALGMAEAAGRPGVLLTGDLALLHDTNGFLLRARLSSSLTVVLINNSGGGIFEHLPVSRFDPPFEEFFATPQQVDFRQLVAAYSAEHVLVRDWAHFIELISTLPGTGIRVLELVTNRKHDAALRKQWFEEVSTAVGEGGVAQ